MCVAARHDRRTYTRYRNMSADMEGRNMAKPQVLILQHADWERPGRILSYLEECELPTQTLRIATQKKPDVSDFDETAGLVVMGGPMDADDTDHFPGLKTEMKLIRACVSSGKPVLGICLGHQLLSLALGGKIKHGSSAEIGIGPIKRVAGQGFLEMWDKSVNVLNWHTDCATLPEGAQLLAKSEATKVQAMRFGSALGLQFHVEVTAPLLEEWLSEPTMVKRLKAAGGSKAQLREAFAAADPQMQAVAEAIFSGFAARCSTYAKALLK